ncbi:MAG: excinuclease ABC subunit UvrC [Desulfitobacteriaceae bacterium]
MVMLHQKLNLLPEKPGVYLMKDVSGQIIYVGKAKILKNRVRSYFTGTHDGKTHKLISLIHDFETIITESEIEALVLECNLIKKYNPKFNILLRDDKSYPYLTITDEIHPRILVTRQVKKGSGKYFGPYPSATAAKEAVKLLNRLFPFRKCRHIPSRPCLYYHLGQCLGPCFEEIPKEAYLEIRKEVTTFLRGSQTGIIKLLEEKMNQAAQSLQFERAQEFRDLIDDLKSLGEKQNITLTDFMDRDVLGYAFTTDQMCVQIFYLRQGKLLARNSFTFPYYEEQEEAFVSFVAQYYTANTLWPQEILLPALNTSVLGNLFPIMIPRRGKKLELVQLCMSNAQTTLHELVALEGYQQDEIEQALTGLNDCLEISNSETIEAFDISNTTGTHIVAGMVQFYNGKPQRSAYRKFKINLMKNTDDTAAINQVIERRYKRLLTEQLPLPNLILVDGGKGQIRAAKQALQSLGLFIPVAGIVKNNRHQTAQLLNETGNLTIIDKDSPTFHFLERVQNEVHRFAITFHRQQRAKNMTLSALDCITGIGPKRRQQLFRHFQSLEGIHSASLKELQGAGLPQNAALNVYQHFQEKSDHNTVNNEFSTGIIAKSVNQEDSANDS